MQAPPVKAIVIGSLVWIVVCFIGGWVVVGWLGDYGSIAHLLIGVAIGLLGTVSHVALSFSAQIRRLNFLKRGLLNWLCAYLLLIAIGALFVNFEMAWSNPNFWPEAAEFLLLDTGAPMLCLALIVSLITSRKSANTVSNPIHKA